MFGYPHGDLVWDIESYPNLFTAEFKHPVTRQKWVFEISDRKNEHKHFIHFIRKCQVNECRWAGYNNIGYDYPVVHFAAMHAAPTASDIYLKSMSIINGTNRFGHIIWDKDQLVPQIDLFKIWHYDNAARSTSLKLLEFNMRMKQIQESKVQFGTIVAPEDIDHIIDYMDHDVDATIMFYDITRGKQAGASEDKIAFREELTAKYGKNFMNHNDTKIGKDFFIMRLEEADKKSCFVFEDGQRKPRQTKRDSINLGEIILPYVKFDHPEFNKILTTLRGTTITNTKGAYKLSCTIDDFTFDFGTGGIHGARKGVYIESDTTAIESRDVASYYPNLAIVNKFCPEHLGELFCKIYKELYEERKRHPKKEYPAINSMLKLALNGVYGDSNNEYSPFYDPKMTMSITVNGQLLLCMLVEKLMLVPSCRLIMINTDGLEFVVDKDRLTEVDAACVEWMTLTGLELESDKYKKILIANCNNYIGVQH